MNKPLCCLLYIVLFWFTFKNENVAQSLLVLEEDLYGQAVKILNSFIFYFICARAPTKPSLAVTSMTALTALN